MKRLVAVFAIVATLLTAVPAMADFYVIPTGTRYKHPEVVSAYMETSNTAETIFTIPAGKSFILTDIIKGSSSENLFTIMENDSIKMKVYLTSSSSGFLSVHLETGIPFASGTEVKV